MNEDRNFHSLPKKAQPVLTATKPQSATLTKTAYHHTDCP